MVLGCSREGRQDKYGGEYETEDCANGCVDPAI